MTENKVADNGGALPLEKYGHQGMNDLCRKHFPDIKRVIQYLIRKKFEEAQKTLGKIQKDPEATKRLNYTPEVLRNSMQKYERFDFEKSFPGAQVVSYQQ